MKLLRVIYYLGLTITLSWLLVFYTIVSEIYPGQSAYPSHAHITLYIDRTFDNMETDAIMKAAWEWSEATNHIIEYDIIQLPTKEKVKHKNSIFIVKRSPDDPQIILMDLVGHNETLGVYEKNRLPTIAIVSERLNDSNYKEIVLHELGHSLGLEHLESLEDLDALMFPYTNMKLEDGTIIPTGSEFITKKDLIQFCKLYHCDADKLKH